MMAGASLAGLGPFAAYFALGVVLTALFVAIYMRLTAHDEIALIRQGNLAAALALGGNLAGFAIPLDKAISQASSIPDCIVWAVVALIVQLLVYVVVRTLVPGLSTKIEENNVAVGTFLAITAISGGMLNAASMTLYPGA
jgi:putative membrane protein